MSGIMRQVGCAHLHSFITQEQAQQCALPKRSRAANQDDAVPTLEVSRHYPHIREGLAEIGHGAVGPFLDEAGKRGWELCTVLPYPTTKEPDGTQAVIFKRPVRIKATLVAEQTRRAHFRH